MVFPVFLPEKNWQLPATYLFAHIEHVKSLQNGEYIFWQCGVAKVNEMECISTCELCYEANHYPPHPRPRKFQLNTVVSISILYCVA